MANNNKFTLTLDTVAPTGSITVPAGAMNSNKAFTISYSEATSTVQYMKAWFNTSSTATTSDSDVPTSWSAAATSVTPSFSSNGTYYLHVILMDSVGNTSAIINSSKVIYDKTAPTGTITLSDKSSSKTDICNGDLHCAIAITETGGAGLTGNVTFTVKDSANSTLSSAVAITGSTGTFTTDINVSSLKNGTLTVTAAFADAAGNAGTATAVNIVLDTTLATPTVSLVQKANHSTVLGTYYNNHDISVHITDSETDIVGYKVWESGTTEPTSYTSQTKGALDQYVDITLSSGDGKKTINVKATDYAGNEKSNTGTVTLDTIAPSLTLAVTNSPFSGKTGHASATVTITANDKATGYTIESGIASYTGTIGSTALTVASGANTITTSTSGLVYGSNTISVTVTDNAGNTTTKTATVVYDNKIESLTLGALADWYTTTFSPKISWSDTLAGLATVNIWADNTAGASTVPSGCANVVGSGTSIKSTTDTEIPATSVSFGQSASTTCYLHAHAVDTVGNTIDATPVKFGYETTAPSLGTAEFAADTYQSTTAAFNITGITKSTSDIAAFRVYGDVSKDTNQDYATVAYTDGTSQYPITLTSGDGDKTIQVTVVDKAGLESTKTTADKTELDTTNPTGTIVLQNAAGVSVVGKNYNSNNPKIVLVGYDDKGSSEGTGTGYAVSYELYGACSKTSGATAETTSTNPITGTLTAGSATITDVYCTSGDGSKEYYVVFVDNAGRKSTAIKTSFDYDTTAPEITIVTAANYNIVSKVDAKRRTSTTTVSDDKCNEIKFSFNADTGNFYQAYKVCAYKDITAAKAGTYADAAIPTTNGSANTSGTGLNTDTAINVTINGADYETALGGTGNDGTHYVVMYIQDLAGNWSASVIEA